VRHVRGPNKKNVFNRQYLVKMKIVIAEIKKKIVVQFIDN